MTQPSSSKISSQQVRRLGELAKLNIAQEDEEKLREELSAVLGYFDVIDGATGEGSKDDDPLERPAEPRDLRPDEPRASDPDGVLKGVPQRRGRLVKAPRVF